MKREIKFRGKRLDNDKWVYGYYGKKINTITGNDQHYVMESTYTPSTNSSYFIDIEVDAETVGQYTGLKDKNGVKIYEGDKLEFTDYDPSHEDIYLNKGVVKYSGFGFDISNRHSVDMDDIVVDELKVIGNIHQNKDQ